MKTWTFLPWFVKSGVLLCLLAPSLPGLAQIVPDVTLPVNSSITPQGNVRIINGGTRAGANLFHSFEQFSIPTGGIAYFNNALDVQNIISRVTGSSISNIDGLIRANGIANLFLINPNGIIFGRNASLNIGGSFLGSTATNINFTDGSGFSAKTPQATPLLTVHIPVGLGFGNNPGTIVVTGVGNSQTDLNPTFAPFPKEIAEGLRVQPGKTLALIGGDVNLYGGILTGGRIEIGSASNGQVRLIPITSGWSLDYKGVPSFNDIQLSQQSLVNAISNDSGDIHLQGRQISLTDGSVALIQNQGSQLGGSINVNASESLEVIGTSLKAKVSSGLFNETVGTGDGGNIGVLARRLNIQDGGKIITRTFSMAKGGSINVNTSNSLQIIGFSPIDPNVVSIINSSSYSNGKAGNVTVSTGRLIILDGGGISSVNNATGSGGDVAVSASDYIELIGINPINYAPSVLGTITYDIGPAGNLLINTSKLIVRDGGRISASTFATGPAGSVTINASDTVDVSGTVPGSVSPSLIDSSAATLDKVIQQLLELPSIPTGASGDVTINTGRLSVTNGALIDVRNDGPQNAGTLRINARSIFLSSKGGITATTTSGEGGNIFLNAHSLQLRRNSGITATATGGGGNGGNITIDTGTLVALENSPITANAIKGRGGNIQIDTQGIFRSPDSAITASSQFGISGTVRISALGFDARNALTPFTGKFANSEQVIANSCLVRRNTTKSSFVSTGTGGLPVTPFDNLDTANDLTAPSQENRKPQALSIEQAQVTAQASSQQATLLELENKPYHPWQPGEPIAEGNTILKTPDGHVLLVALADQTSAQPSSSLMCH